MNFELHPDLQRDGIVVGRFPLCLILLINDSHYPWFVLVPQRPLIRDTIDLAEADYATLWDESRQFGTAIMRAFNGDKLNVVALGNVVPQLHVHHIVRYITDAAWPSPIWGKHPMKSYTQEELNSVREKLDTESLRGFTAATLFQKN